MTEKIARNSWRNKGEENMRVFVLILLMMFGAVEIDYFGQGVMMVEAHKPKPDPNPVRRDPNRDNVGGEFQYWYVVRHTRPEIPVFGPFISPEPECLGYERRFPTIYACRRLP